MLGERMKRTNYIKINTMENITNDQLSGKYNVWQNEILSNEALKKELDNAPIEQSKQMLKFLTLFAIAADESKIFDNNKIK